MYKVLLFAFVCLNIAGCSRSPVSKFDTSGDYSFATSTPNSITNTNTVVESLPDAIKSQLAAKYKRNISEINLTVTTEEINFAKGSVSFAGEMGGALWMAAKSKGGWILVHDGQGPMSCDLAEEYAFPTSYVPQCVSGTEMVKR